MNRGKGLFLIVLIGLLISGHFAYYQPNFDLFSPSVIQTLEVAAEDHKPSEPNDLGHWSNTDFNNASRLFSVLGRKQSSYFTASKCANQSVRAPPRLFNFS